MRIIHVNTSDLDGGAARAANRLHRGLLAAGVRSSLFVLNRETTDPDTIQLLLSSRMPRRLLRLGRREYLRRSIAPWLVSRPPGSELFSDDRSACGIEALGQLPRGEIIHLHWVAGFVDYKDFLPAAALRAPLVWTLHDMNPFTGGCHYDDGCGRFTAHCGHCPQLAGGADADFSAGVFRRKAAAYRKVNAGRLYIVTPSTWMAEEARRSALLKSAPIFVIPYGLDLDTFTPQDRRFARKVFGLSEEKKIILCAAQCLDQRRKGMALLVEALAGLPRRDDIQLVSIGHRGAFPEPPISHVSAGYVRDDRLLSLAYSAADIFVCPTLQDNFPNTILESIACGLPVVGFRVGGVPEMVRDGVTGFLAERGDSGALRAAMIGLLENQDLRSTMANNCRRIAAEEYGQQLQASRYVQLYEMILENST